MKLLDCTLRDGGYYTHWDFDDGLVEDYAKAMEALPIDYVEVGYRSIPLKGYLGKYFYCPEYVLKKLKVLMPSKKMVIILNEKDIKVNHIQEGLLNPCLGLVDMIRIAVDPKNILSAVKLAKAVKELGFEVAFNVMYMSNWKNYDSFFDSLEGLEEFVDYFYMVDSYGGIMPNEIKETVSLLREKTKVKLGFHGHDNLSMALVNTITAMEMGCEIIDATITGMGRGAGNLKTELLLTYLENQGKVDLNYNVLGSVVADFEVLKNEYQWGINLPYMFSGAYSLPQKQVMDWVGMNRYPLNSILNALNNKKNAIEDNERLPIFNQNKKYKRAIILGGGKSAKQHKVGLQKYLENNNDEVCLIHAGVRNVTEYNDVNCDQFFALVGFESEKLLKQIGDYSKINQTCIYPPFPRKMGTIIPNEIKDLSFELGRISFTNSTSDSPMAIAIQTALDLGCEKLYFAGFDGYDTQLNKNQFMIAKENQQIINDLLSNLTIGVETFTPSNYQNLPIAPLYCDL